jgi:hypothetical protein
MFLSPCMLEPDLDPRVHQVHGLARQPFLGLGVEQVLTSLCRLEMHRVVRSRANLMPY